MSTKKNIDHLFQEKLEGLEKSPSLEVWNSLEAKLQKKEQKKRPIWWWFNGLAASLLLAITLIRTSSENQESHPTNNKITSPTSTPIEVEKTTIAIAKKKPVKKTIPISPQNKSDIKKTRYENIQKPLLASTESFLYPSDRRVLSGPKIVMKKNFSYSKEHNNVHINPPTKPSEKKGNLPFFPKTKISTDPILAEKKWEVSPVVVMSQNNSLTNTSPIDESLAATKTQGEYTFSYGVKVAFAVNKKWTLQSGVFMQKIAYAKQGLSVLEDVKSIQLKNIDVNTEADFMLSSPLATCDVSSLNAAKVSTRDASLSQRYSYIEIPIEIGYTLVETKKISSKIITGFSSLFLQQNEIILSSENQVTTLGKANNLNRINFSGNLGLDIQYQLYKNFKLSINPMCKVSLHTFTENSTDFKPFSLGIHSGIIYQF